MRVKIAKNKFRKNILPL